MLAVALLAVAAGAHAEGSEGAQPLVCDFVKAAECDGVAVCSNVTPEEIDLASIIRIDFAARKITEPGGDLHSPIATIEDLGAVVILQGQENNRGWTLVIDRASGHLSATIADASGAFVLAGACAVE
jgi:hypothetical protein